MKKAISLLILLALAACALAGCSSDKGNASAEPTTLSFSDSTSFDTIKKLDGRTVIITGYMATISPLNGKFIYLMNLPYQSCPFCVPNTTQLSNTMAVYAADGQSFEYTDRPVRVTGTIEVGDFIDDFGYEYNYRIANASCEPVDLSNVSTEYALYQSLAEDGTITDVNAMFDYLYFICQWPDYTSSYVDEDGNTISYFLYAGDVTRLLEDDGAYGYKTQASADYFPSLIRRVESVSTTELTDLVQILTDAQTLESDARAELDNGNYVYNEDEDRFYLNASDELYDRFYEVYDAFSMWLTRYQL